MRNQLAVGTQVEFEHTSNPVIARRIAMDHLKEDPNYYRKLRVVESPLFVPGTAIVGGLAIAGLICWLRQP